MNAKISLFLFLIVQLTYMLCPAASVQSATANTEFSRLTTKVVIPSDTATVGKPVIVRYEMTCHLDTTITNPDDFKLEIVKESIPADVLMMNFALNMSFLNTTVINGETDTELMLVWILTLKANKSGGFKTPDYALYCKGQPIEVVCKKEYIEVINQGKKKENHEYSPSMPVDLPVKLRAIPDKTEITLGDAIIYKLELTAGNSIAIITSEKVFEVEDCHVEQINSDDEITFENINGNTIAKCQFLKYRITPLRAGSFTLPRMRYRGMKTIETALVDNFMSLTEAKYKEFVSETDAVNIKVFEK